jgi:hypothetical protein
MDRRHTSKCHRPSVMVRLSAQMRWPDVQSKPNEARKAEIGQRGIVIASERCQPTDWTLATRCAQTCLTHRRSDRHVTNKGNSQLEDITHYTLVHTSVLAALQVTSTSNHYRTPLAPYVPTETEPNRDGRTSRNVFTLQQKH